MAARSAKQTEPGNEVATVDEPIDAEVISEGEDLAEVSSALEETSSFILPASRAWEEVKESDWIEGFDLEKNKDELVGVPFIVTRAIFRDGKYARGKEILPSDFVSLEIVTAPEDIYDKRVPKNRRRYSEFGLPLESEVGPGEAVVINDSSTGIKRQIVWYLHSSGRITIDPDLPREFSNMTGSIGESVFDKDPIEWAEGESVARGDGFEFRLGCKRGLRFSVYENDFTPSGKTYYLA